MDDMQTNLAVSECDVLFSIGTRFNDRITGDLNEFAPNAKIVHVDIDTASISRNVVVDVPIVADAKLAIQRLLEWGRAAKDGEMESLHCTVGRRKSVADAKRPWTDPTDDHGRHQSGI